MHIKKLILSSVIAALIIRFAQIAGADGITAGQSVPNPVIYKLADAGMMKYNGEYYIMGNDLKGGMLKSENLVNWDKCVHVFSMNNAWATGDAGADKEIHACDLKYIDGVFHLYWSVNRSDIGVRHIGHAITKNNPMNFYTEPVTSTWFANYIDAHIFVDDDGKCYFYTVKFPSGNTNYGQAMTSPWTCTGTDYSMLYAPSSCGTWEYTCGIDPPGSQGNLRVNEGPFVITYRGRYYMLYAANATWNANYAIGCAESTDWKFDNTEKYPTGVNPVLKRALRGGHEVTHIGQPSVLRGPNGFEWWMSYFAKYDGGSKSQSIERVVFFDRQMYVIGPSSNLADYMTGLYMPPPASPTLGDLFNEGTSLASYWDIKSGTWDINNNEARQTDPSGIDNKTIIKSAPAKNYLVEAGVKLMDKYAPDEKAGLTAYYADTDNWMIVALDQKYGKWYSKRVENGNSPIVENYSLPADFNYTVYHNVRVTKNNSTFNVWIDERPAAGNPVISTGFTGAGRPGLYTEAARACFDGFIYTIGWDEWDAGITGWSNAQGTWTVGSSGIAATDENVTSSIYKGDMLDQYEFMTQVTKISTGVDSGDEMGIYAIYTDADNWLTAGIKPDTDQLHVYGKIGVADIGDYVATVADANSYNLRVIKRDDATRIFVDGILKITVPLNWPASQVGLYAKNIAARFNGITAFRLGSQYGDTPTINEPMSDNFDDSIFSTKWQNVPVHATNNTLQTHNTLPDIVAHESNRRLRFSGTEKGDDTAVWYGRGLKYNEPVYGSSTVRFDFDSFEAFRDDATTTYRAAIGLRIQKDPNNWFEVRQTDDTDGDKLEYTKCSGGAVTTSSASVINKGWGNLKLRFDNSIGEVRYYLDGTERGTVRGLSGLKNSEYYFYITAYTSNDGNRILCDVDNFRIFISSANLNNDFIVDMNDFAIFAGQWLSDNCDAGNLWCARCDFDEDGDVDMLDLAEFTKDWLLDLE